MSEGKMTVKPVNAGSIWRTVQAVAWSFLGVRKSSEFQQDIAQLTPYRILAIGFIGGLLFVLGLMLLVNWIVAP